MTDTTSKLSAEEAQAIEAISGVAAPAPQGTSSATTTDAIAGTTAVDADHAVDAQFDLPVDGPASQGFISAADAPAGEHDVHGEHGEPVAHHEAQGETQVADDADMLAMRSAMLDSAELANRAAGMAAKAAAEMHSVTTDMQHVTGEMHTASAAMVESHGKQRLNGIVVLATFGALMLTSMALFGIMSYRLQSRISQADEMLLAVGKRIVAMNEAMELITGAGETLRDISSRQDTIVGGQAKLDTRLDEVVSAMAQAAAQAASKPADSKGAPDLAKLIQALDAKIQSQSTALNALSSQVRAAPAAPRPDPAAVRREIEAALRQQKAAEAAAKPVVVAPPAPPAPPPKPKETLVQYPRTQPQGKENP